MESDSYNYYLDKLRQRRATMPNQSTRASPLRFCEEVDEIEPSQTIELCELNNKNDSDEFDFLKDSSEMNESIQYEELERSKNHSDFQDLSMNDTTFDNSHFKEKHQIIWTDSNNDLKKTEDNTFTNVNKNSFDQYKKYTTFLQDNNDEFDQYLKDTIAFDENDSEILQILASTPLFAKYFISSSVLDL